MTHRRVIVGDLSPHRCIYIRPGEKGATRLPSIFSPNYSNVCGLAGARYAILTPVQDMRISTMMYLPSHCLIDNNAIDLPWLIGDQFRNNASAGHHSRPY